ncbi:MAG: TOBE-like domain-containing protein, partial [Bacillus sp. (in: firmicutes)]
NVNLFKGRLHKGKLTHGNFEVDVPDFSETENTEAVGYVRPHDISIERENSIDSVSAKINYIHLVGAAVQLELVRKDNGEFLEAEITKEQYRTLHLKTGEEVFVKPKQLKVFIPQDYSI